MLIGYARVSKADGSQSPAACRIRRADIGDGRGRLRGVDPDGPPLGEPVQVAHARPELSRGPVSAEPVGATAGMTLGLPRPPPIVEIEEGAKKEFVLLTPVRLRVGAANRLPAPPLQEAVPLSGPQDRDVETPTPSRPHIPRCFPTVSGFTRRAGVGGARET